MPKIKITCKDHNEIELNHENVSAMEYDPSYSHNEKYQYRTICPIGSEIIIVNITRESFDKLASAGCNIEDIDYPREECLAEFAQLTHDDLIDFHFNIESIGHGHITKHFDF